MKALYLDQLSGNPERLQQKSKQTVMGAKVFEWNLLRALLEYGTYDVYLAPGVTDEVKEQLVEDGLEPEGVKRLVAVSLGSRLPVKDSDHLVLLTAGRYLDLLANLRNRLRRYDAPICGFIHSINSARVALAILQQCFVGLSEADLLLCSSRAGMQTIDMYISEVASLLKSNMDYPVRRALVPLGVNMPTVQESAKSMLRERLSLKAQDVVALYLGRLSQNSKCDLGPLLVAFSQLLEGGTKLHLIIAGDDTQTKETPRLQALATELLCEKSLTIWTNPSASEKHLLYSGADFLVSPSDNLQETFGLSVAEGMAYGLPAVVSDWDGYRDLVRDGENGFLIPATFPANIESLRLCDSTFSMLEEDSLAQSTVIDIASLSQRLGQLAMDQTLRNRMSQTARSYVENHCTWAVVVRRYEELWEESLQAATKVAPKADSSGNLLSAPLGKCFGHYASAKLSRKARCFVTTEGREWLKRPGRLYFLSQMSSAPCPQKFADMLRHIEGRPGLSVEETVKSAMNNSHGNGTDFISESNAQWTLARLFKYGLVSDKPTT